MPKSRLLAAILLAAAVAGPAAAAATPKPFSGPATGWDHTVLAPPGPTATHVQELWKKSDSEQIMYLEDSGLVYDTIIASLKDNISTRNLKPSVDRDRTCDGRRAHEVELTFGNSVVHQVIVDDAPGVTKINFTWPDGKTESPDAAKALIAYCGA